MKIINQRLTYPHLIVSVKLPLISWLFTIFFNFGYVHFISSVLKNVYIKNSSDNSAKYFMVREMYGCPCMIKKINFIFVSVIICSVADNLIITSTWRRRNKYYSVLIQKCFEWMEYWLYCSIPLQNLSI